MNLSVAGRYLITVGFHPTFQVVFHQLYLSKAGKVICEVSIPGCPVKTAPNTVNPCCDVYISQWPGVPLSSLHTINMCST